VSSSNPSTNPAKRTYVLDTSVLLADPAAMTRFAEHDVVLPIVVITELEGKRHHPELGYFARKALRYLDDLRVQYGRLDEPMPTGDGTIRVELNHSDPSILPVGFRLGDNDTRILTVARSLAAEGCDVVLVSKDLPMRVKAASIGLSAEEYRAELVVESGWTGMAEVQVTTEDVGTLFEHGTADLEEARDLPTHTGLRMLSAKGSALGRVLPDKSVRLVRGDREVFGLHGRSAEQRIALDLLMDPEIGIVSLGGRAPASRRWHSARAWRPCWSAASTARWSSSAPCTPWAARSSATCPAPRARRWARGPRRSSTPWARSALPR
jgi:PhoH-like ATPase